MTDQKYTPDESGMNKKSSPEDIYVPREILGDPGPLIEEMECFGGVRTGGITKGWLIEDLEAISPHLCSTEANIALGDVPMIVFTVKSCKTTPAQEVPIVTLKVNVTTRELDVVFTHEQDGTALTEGQKFSIVLSAGRIVERMLVSNGAQPPMVARDASPEYMMELMEREGWACQVQTEAGGMQTLLGSMLDSMPVWPGGGKSYRN